MTAWYILMDIFHLFAPKYAIINSDQQEDSHMQNRQKTALEYAIKYLHISEIAKHISDVILYGSVARGEEHFNSDVDILIVLQDNFLATYENKKNIRRIVSDLADPWETLDVVEKNIKKHKIIQII